MVGWYKRIQGSLAGGSNPIDEMPNLLNLYHSGHLKLDEIITQRYALEQSTRATTPCLRVTTSAV